MKCTLSYPVADIYEIWRSLRRNRHVLYLCFLFNIEYLAEAGHVEYALYQWLKVAYDKFASFLGKVLVQPEEYA